MKYHPLKNQNKNPWNYEFFCVKVPILRKKLIFHILIHAYHAWLHAHNWANSRKIAAEPRKIGVNPHKIGVEPRKIGDRRESTTTRKFLSNMRGPRQILSLKVMLL